MKKIQSLAILLGVVAIFTGAVAVLAKTKIEEKPENKVETTENKVNEDGKEVSGQFDYFFNDGTMNRKYYGIQQNEAKETQPGNEGQFDNKTNINHVLAFCAIFREGLRQVLIDLLNENGVKSLENCEFEDLTKELSTKTGVNITKKDIETILSYFSMCCTEPGMAGDFGVLGTQFFNVREEAYSFLKRVFEKIKNIKLTDKMLEDGWQYAIKVANDKLKDRINKNEEIVRYEGREYFENYNGRLKDIVEKFQHADLGRVRDVCGVFECKDILRDERIRNIGEAKG